MSNKAFDWVFLLLFVAIALLGFRLAAGDPMGQMLALSAGIGCALPVAAEIYHTKGE